MTTFRVFFSFITLPIIRFLNVFCLLCRFAINNNLCDCESVFPESGKRACQHYMGHFFSVCRPISIHLFPFITKTCYTTMIFMSDYLMLHSKCCIGSLMKQSKNVLNTRKMQNENEYLNTFQYFCTFQLRIFAN